MLINLCYNESKIKRSETNIMKNLLIQFWITGEVNIIIFNFKQSKQNLKNSL